MPRLVLLSLLATGCVWSSTDDTVEGSAGGLSASTPAATVDGLEVRWEVESDWGTGACVRLAVESASGDIAWWDLEVELANTYDEWVGGYGAADVQPWGTRSVGVLPYDGRLEEGVSTEVSYCTEPAALPAGFSGTAVPEAGSGGSSGGSGSGSSGGSGSGSSGGSDGGATTGPHGGLTSNGWGLAWETAGTSYDGQCMEFTLVNLTDEPLADWWAQIILERPASVTDSWGVAGFTFDSNILWVLPPSYEDSPIDARGTVTGTVCLDPWSEPIGFNVFGEEVEGGTGGGSGSEGGSGSGGDDGITLRGELYDPESGWVVRYSDGGSTETEHCVNLMFANLSGRDATNWEARIGLDGVTNVTRDWSFDAYTYGGSSELHLIPEDYAKELDHGDVVWGGLCMDPVATPVSLIVEAVE